MGDEHRGVQVPPELHAVPPRPVEVGCVSLQGCVLMYTIEIT